MKAFYYFYFDSLGFRSIQALFEVGCQSACLFYVDAKYTQKKLVGFCFHLTQQKNKNKSKPKMKTKKNCPQNEKERIEIDAISICNARFWCNLHTMDINKSHVIIYGYWLPTVIYSNFIPAAFLVPHVLITRILEF